MAAISTYLKHAEIFDEFTPTQFELVASIARLVQLQAGDLIFTEGSSGTELYIIAHGEVLIEVNPIVGERDNAEPQVIAVFGRGQSFGELALVDQGLRSATARIGNQQTLLVVIPQDKLLLLCQTYFELGYKLMRNLAADLALKIRNTDLQMRDYITYNPPPQS